MAGFVQIIEFKSSRFDEIEKLAEQYDLNSGDNTARSVRMTEDRDNPGTYYNIVEFDSHESAMKNSQRPEVGQFAEAMAKICDGAPKFYNLDVRMTR